VIAVPPNRPCQRRDHPIEFYGAVEDANKRRWQLVRSALQTGLPMLIGTDSTAESTEVFKFVNRVKYDCIKHSDTDMEWGMQQQVLAKRACLNLC
jgi:preprotein translocase subunit SecA